MFTGIISHCGRFIAYRHGVEEMVIEAPEEILGLDIGASVSINGVCLSIIRKESNQVTFNLSEETLKKTNLGRCHRGDRLNLEVPLTLSTPLSGHLVSGHIDRTERVLRILTKKGGKRIGFSLSPEIRPFFIPKGSCAINGVSLTIAELSATSFEVEVIPISLETTNLGDLKRGETVNVESDMVGKYVYNWISRK
jgi:riboflavin synthase